MATTKCSPLKATTAALLLCLAQEKTEYSLRASKGQYILGGDSEALGTETSRGEEMNP